MLEFKNVSKKFGSRVVVDGISLQLASFQTHVLLGQSGSGKSTLVRLATGIAAPTSGQILLNNGDITQLGLFEKSKLFGYMIQDGGLYPHLTCKENILISIEAREKVNKSHLDRLKDLAEMVHIEGDLLLRYPRQISGGQRQRVALMRSLIHDPPLIFLDEPLGALDPLVRNNLQNELRQIFKKLKKTVVLVTHDLAEAAFFADTLTLLKDGHIEQHDTVQKFIECPRTKYVEEYLGAQRPPDSLLKWSRGNTP